MADHADHSLANAPGSTVPSGGKGAASVFDPRRFDHLSESEVLRRIGTLLATVLARSGRLLPKLAAPSADRAGAEAVRVDPWQLIGDPLERQIAQYLLHAGPAGPEGLRVALGISERTVGRKLARLRAAGLCEVVGKTRAARYRLIPDHGRN